MALLSWAASHDVLDSASRCFEPLVITAEIADSMELSGRQVLARYASGMTAAMATDRPQRNVYDPRVRELIRATGNPDTATEPHRIMGIGRAFERCRSTLTRRGVRNAAVFLLALAGTAHYAARLNQSYPVKDWLFWPIALLWLYNIVLFGAIISAGYLVVSRVLRLELPRLETLAVSIPVGLVVFCWAMYALGALHLFRTWAAVVLVVAFIAAGARPLARFARDSLETWRERAVSRHTFSEAAQGVLTISFGVICLALVYLPLISPLGLDFDSLWYHLTVAQDYAREGRIVPFEGDYPRNWPQLAPLLHTWGWLMPVPGTLQRWTLPLHTEFFVFLGTLVGVTAVVRYLLEPNALRFAWVGFFLFPYIFVYDQCLAGSADHFLELFAPCLFLSAARAAKSLQRRDRIFRTPRSSPPSSSSGTLKPD